MIDISRVTRNGRSLFLAYDQGLEHGPSDFNDTTIDPDYIVSLSDTGYFTGIILQKGVAEKYYNTKKHSTPLIIKLNGKTTLESGEPFAPPLCSVEEAKKIGAHAVGYTIYPGSAFQEKMMEDFAYIQEKAHKMHLPVILWMYPRGKKVKGKEKSRKLSMYAARIGLELGADILKMYYPEKDNVLKEMVKAAGKTKIVISGGQYSSEKTLYLHAKTAIKNGCIGMAVGRNIWQAPYPEKRAKKLADIIFKTS